jgi:hypothetical protein
MISRKSVYAALDWVNQDPTFGRCLSHPFRELQFRSERELAGLFSNELDAPQQTNTADIPNYVRISQRIEAPAQLCRGGPLLCRICRLHQVSYLQMTQHRTSRRQ